MQTRPTPDEREVARRVEEALAARAADQWAIVQSATARLGQAPAMDRVVDVPHHQAAAAAVTSSQFDDQKRDRLHAWLRKHAADRDLLILDNGKARLGLGVPRAETQSEPEGERGCDGDALSCCRSRRHAVKLPALAARSPWG